MPLISNFICESCGELHEIALVCLQCGKPLVADVEVKPFEQIIFKLHFCEQCIGELSRTITQTVGKQGYKQGFSDARGQWAKEHEEGEKEAEELSEKFLETIKDQQGPIPRTGYRTTDEAGKVITKGGNIQELHDRLYTDDALLHPDGSPKSVEEACEEGEEQTWFECPDCGKAYPSYFDGGDCHCGTTSLCPRCAKLHEADHPKPTKGN